MWGPFVLALVLGAIVSTGLYFAYVWPQPEPEPEPGDSTSPEER